MLSTEMNVQYVIVEGAARLILSVSRASLCGSYVTL